MRGRKEDMKAAMGRSAVPVQHTFRKDLDHDFARLTVQVPSELHQAFKARCVERKVSMSDALRSLIEAELSR